MKSTEAPVNDFSSVVPAMTLSLLDWIALIIVIAGGVNWGLVGLLNMDLVGAALGSGTAAARAVYLLVGLAALYCIFFAFRMAGLNRRASSAKRVAPL